MCSSGRRQFNQSVKSLKRISTHLEERCVQRPRWNNEAMNQMRKSSGTTTIDHPRWMDRWLYLVISSKKKMLCCVMLNENNTTYRIASYRLVAATKMVHKLLIELFSSLFHSSRGMVGWSTRLALASWMDGMDRFDASLVINHYHVWLNWMNASIFLIFKDHQNMIKRNVAVWFSFALNVF